MEDVNEFFYLFLNLNAVLKKSAPRKFAYIWLFSRIEINAAKFVKTWIHFKIEFFAAVAVVVVDVKAP